LTAIVSFAGAAGIFNLENPSALREEGLAGSGITSYGEAVWWTAMTMTTMGSDYFPKTPEGRLLGWALAVYAFVVFGYVTATLASYFVGNDRKEDEKKAGEKAAGPAAELAALRAEVAALRDQLAELTAAVKGRAGRTGRTRRQGG